MNWRHFAIAFALILAPTDALAAHGQVEATPVQRDLHDRAFDAFVAGDTSTALTLYRASITIRPLNTVWANIGRAEFTLGRCEAAEAAYNQAETTQGDTSPADMAVLLARYRADLPERCGQLRVTCTDRQTRVRVGDVRHRCDGSTVWLSPGTHNVHAEFRDGGLQRQIDIAPGGAIQELLLAPPTAEASLAPKVEDGDTSLLGMGGGISLALGGATLATVLVLDLTITTPTYRELQRTDDPSVFDRKKRDYDEARRANLTLFVGGSVLVASGLVALIWDALLDDELATSWTPTVGSESVGASWALSF